MVDVLVYLVSEITAFSTTAVFLSLVSYYDFKNREVENVIIGGGAIIGGVITLLSGHLFHYFWQHIIAVPTTFMLAIVLFKLGAIGGADFKTLLIISFVSPGIEFYDSPNPVFECGISVLIQILVMLTLGQIWHILNRTQEQECKAMAPLLPFLLVAYLGIQAVPLMITSWL